MMVSLVLRFGCPIHLGKRVPGQKEASPLVPCGGSGRAHSENQKRGALARNLATNRSEWKLSRFPQDELICECKSGLFVLSRLPSAAGFWP